MGAGSAVLSCAVLSCAVLSCAVFSRAVLSCAVFSRAVFSRAVVGGHLTWHVETRHKLYSLTIWSLRSMTPPHKTDIRA
ncbi:MAG: pentapeptide repeat-containing protein [Propionibacteriaceae bacterium]